MSALLKGFQGFPVLHLIFTRRKSRNYTVSLMPWRADLTSIRNEGIRGWDGFAECVVGDILLHVSGDSGADFPHTAANQPGFHVQVRLNPPCKPRNYIKSSRWNGIF